MKARSYVVSEFRATVAAFALDAQTGKLGAMKISAPHWCSRI